MTDFDPKDALADFQATGDPIALRCDASGAGPPELFGASDFLEDLEAARAYIQAIDFQEQKAKMSSPEGIGWSDAKLDFAESVYKRWLFLRRKHRGELMPPTEEIDAFWHAHILDTLAYHRDCLVIFGEYFHHFPYFGTRGQDDHKKLLSAFENTLARYSEEYGEKLTNFKSGPGPQL